MKEEFVDGGLGHNNPVELAVKEAMEIFDLETNVACIVSIGSGRRSIAGFKKPRMLQRVMPVDLINVMAKMVTSTETASNILEERYRNCPGLYHRLNVEIGLDDVALAEWNRLSEVKFHTLVYLETPEVRNRIDEIANCLLGMTSHSYRLGALGE